MSCAKHYNFSGVVIDEVSKTGVGDAVIKYAWNPGTYPFDNDGYEAVGVSETNGQYEVEVETEHNFGGYMIAEHPSYWSPAPFGNDDYDSIHLFRKSWLSFTLHDDPNINYGGTFGYTVNRSYIGTDWLNVGNDVTVNEYASDITVYDNQQFNFLLAGDRQNALVLGAGVTTHSFMDTSDIITPAWGDTVKYDFYY